MSDTVLIALIYTIPTTLFGMAAFITSVRNGRRLNTVIRHTNGILAASKQQGFDDGSREQLASDVAGRKARGESVLPVDKVASKG